MLTAEQERELSALSEETRKVLKAYVHGTVALMQRLQKALAEVDAIADGYTLRHEGLQIALKIFADAIGSMPIETAPKDGTPIRGWCPLLDVPGFRTLYWATEGARGPGWVAAPDQYYSPSEWLPFQPRRMAG